MNDKIEQLLIRGVVEINIKADLEKKLRFGKKLRIKLGIDPTGSDLHLGHLVALRKLAEFQKLGHQVVLLFGTFTGKIGDPTGKDKMRQPLTDAEINKNMQSYLEQAGKVLDISKTEVVKNGDWLAKMNFEDILKLAGSFTVSQMIQRDMFQERLKNNRDINMVEFFYPLMQGYDSVAIKADVELGGTDQLFNLMAGRKIQEAYGMTPQNIMTMSILEGTSGVEKMSKSLDNYIGVMESSKQIFGKTMSIPDHLMSKYFELLTDLSRHDIDQLLAGHPRDAKLQLAEEITTMLHDEKAAHKAREEFLNVFAQGGLPSDIAEMKLAQGEYPLLDLVIKSELCVSNSEARRKIGEGAVKIDDIKYNQLDEPILINDDPKVLQVGKRKFVKFVAE